MLQRILQGAALAAIITLGGATGGVAGGTVDCPVILSEECLPDEFCSEEATIDNLCNNFDSEECDYGGECWPGENCLPNESLVKCCDSGNCI